jgi:trans-aconitate 2-methyltransferase
VLMRETADNGPWSDKLAAASSARPAIAGAAWYYELLRPLCARVDIWKTTYYHFLADSNAIVEWFKGSGLRPFLAPLNDAERAEFLVRYSAAVRRAFPALKDGSVMLPFPRVFLAAIR